MNRNFLTSAICPYAAMSLLMVLGLYLAKLYSYLLFHSLLELFSIAVALGIFMVAWNSREFAENDFLLFMGIAYFFVAWLDLFHTLSYPGMGVFHDADTNLTAQFWIAARYYESVALLIAPSFLKKTPSDKRVQFTICTLILCLLLGAIFLKMFPKCFIEGKGLTHFKIFSEYAICLILIAATARFSQMGSILDRQVLYLMSASILVTVLSELSFTLYKDPYGLFNMLGHFLKVISFFLIYRVLIEFSLKKPYASLFLALKENEKELIRARDEMEKQAEKRTSELHMFKSVIDASEEAIAVSNSEGNLIYINPAHEKLFGRSLDEAKQCNYRDYYPPESVEILNKVVAPALARGESWEGELDVFDSQKRRFPLWERAGTIFDDKGKMICAFGLMHDISDRRRSEQVLRESEDRYRGLFDNMKNGVAVYEVRDKGRDFVFRDFNKAAENMDGDKKEDLIGKSIFEARPGVEKFGLTDIFRSVWETGEPAYHPVRLYQDDRLAGWYDNYVYKLPSGEICAVFDNVTEIKQAEEELNKYHEHLEELVRARTAELELARAQAESANRAKSAFLANMSHELRTPLNAILGFTQVMMRDPEISDRLNDDLGSIARSGEHLLGLINDILELSKIEAGLTVVTENSFDIRHMLNTLEEMTRIRVRKKGLELVFELCHDAPAHIRTDEKKLRQVLINLLNNAVKFTAKGRVRLQAEFKNSRLYFFVEDTGVGIARDDMGKLFRAFLQTENGQKMQEGTGLGLAISQKFVQAMGGEIRVSSEVGKGSVFSFDIPVKPAYASEIRSRRPSLRVIGIAPDQPAYRILIVEDRYESRALLRRLLESVGFEVCEAENGQEGFESFEKWNPHLIWMDMRMPVMNGYEAAEKIRQTAKGQAAAIIALTASAFEETKALVLSAGCDDFVRKPFREAEIFDMMRKHLGVRYVCEDDRTAEPASDRKAGESLENLPPGLLDDLEDAAIRLDMDRMNTLIGDIRHHDPKLGDALSLAANMFDYDEVLRLIQRSEA